MLFAYLVLAVPVLVFLGIALHPAFVFIGFGLLAVLFVGGIYTAVTGKQPPFRL